MSRLGGLTTSRRHSIRTGATILNKQTGESLTMLAGEDVTQGRLQRYRVHLPPHRSPPPPHYHLAFTEIFTCEKGTLDIYLGREHSHAPLRAGASVSVPIGEIHTFANTSDELCTMLVETSPPGGVVQAFQLAYGLANRGQAGKDGLPRNPLYRLRFIAISQGFLPRIPLLVQKAVLGLANLVSRLTGAERTVQDFLSDDPPVDASSAPTTVPTPLH